MFQSKRGPVGLVLTGCALTGIVLMGVPCGSSKTSSPTVNPKAPAVPVTGSFVPSNARVDDSISASEATTLTLEGIDGAFVFVGGQQWLDYEDGTARLIAELSDAGDRNRRFELSLQASVRRFPADLGGADFNLALDPSAYKDQGGMIDPDLWLGFGRFAGSLTGMADLTGTDLTLELEPDTVLQLGEGANGVNAYYGASASLLWHRAGGENIPTGGAASVSFTLQADTVSRASAAQSEEPFHGSGHLHAVTLPGISQRMVFTAGGRLTERPDGTARLAGVLVEAGNPARSFHMDLRLTERVSAEDEAFPPAGSPKLELNSSSYVASGGPIDPETWIYYEGFEGTLVGLGDFRGAELTVTRRGAPFQVGIGASGKNGRNGGAGWLNTTVNVQPETGITLPGTTGGDINIDLDGSGTSSCAMPAVRDDVARYGGGHAIWIPGLATDFVFQPGAMFVERADGSARLEGIAYSASDPSLMFLAGVNFADRIDPQAPGYPPTSSPKLELQSSAYVAGGGTVDPNGWHYYGNTLGELKGLGRLRGASIRVDRRGPAFQIGNGASGKNERYGACGWLNVSVLSQPQSGPTLPSGFTYGDINIDLGDDCITCATAARYDGDVAKYQGGHAFYLPGISHDFMFESGASFVEKASGTARITGTLFSPTRPGWRFEVLVELSDRIDPGQAGYPPTNSPKKELISSSFTGQGGPIDTGAWRYYETFGGDLIGIDELAGAKVHVERVGPAFQVGLGADGKNFGFGAAGWLDVTVIDQPTTGISLPGQLQHGDINLDLMEDCSLCAVGAARDSEISNLPGSAAFYLAGVGSQWFDFEGPASYTERPDGTATLTGVIHDVAGGDCRWAVDLTFSSMASPANGDDLPADSPKRDFIASHYVDNGGPTDFTRWRYYQHTEGEFIGLGGHTGARIALSRMGPSFQIGFGASGANERWGASGWLTTELLSQPEVGPAINISSADFNVDLGEGCGICATPAMLDSEATNTSGDHSFYFPGIGTDFVFDGPAPFIENADGTARMTGEIYRPGEPQKRFRVEVDFSLRVDPGMSNYPPEGSPKLELYTSYYLASGGLVDPSTWHYYEHFEGRAFGLDAVTGAELFYERLGPPFQIGTGASGKNVDFGGSGWMSVQIVQQPSNGPQLVIPAGFHGDINVNFSTDCGEE
ncbi:MAG: hypothetical protein ACJAZN_001657 [Planctomycetota bacterium]|jgi:hypothetical protein